MCDFHKIYIFPKMYVFCCQFDPNSAHFRAPMGQSGQFSTIFRPIFSKIHQYLATKYHRTHINTILMPTQHPECQKTTHFHANFHRAGCFLRFVHCAPPAICSLFWLSRYDPISESGQKNCGSFSEVRFSVWSVISIQSALAYS